MRKVEAVTRRALFEAAGAMAGALLIAPDAGAKAMEFLAAGRISPTEPAQQSGPGESMGQDVPTFDPDPSWPKLPNEWILGNVSMCMVDNKDHVWLIHRPRMPGLIAPANKKPAPPVLQFDTAGKLLQAWGGPAPGFDWPDTEHCIYVDDAGDVYISGSSPNNSPTMLSDDMVLKFTNNGKFIHQMGGRSTCKGNLDTKNVNKPGGMFVDSKAKEIFLADGYGNRRVIVLDAETLAYKRMWGAFGGPVWDVPGSGGGGTNGGPAPSKIGEREYAGPPTLDTEGFGSPTFSSPVHGALISKDRILYVVDRSNRRFQMFTPDGKYLDQMFINRSGPAAGSISGLAFSADADQKFLYAADYGNSHIAVIDRKNLKVLYQFGKRSAAPGDFQGIHKVAADSQDNLYTAEVAPGHRIQKFAFKGLSQSLPHNALPPTDLAPKAPVG